jgi:hypothetical protein
MAGDRRLIKGSGKRVELEAAWNARVQDADAMLAAERFESAIAAGIYAVEILLKSLICKRLGIDFLPAVFEIHDLESLTLHAGLRNQLELREGESLEFQRNWAFIREIATKLNDFRYQPDHPESRDQALRFFEQLRHPETGVLTWLMEQT